MKPSEIRALMREWGRKGGLAQPIADKRKRGLTLAKRVGHEEMAERGRKGGLATAARRKRKHA